MRFRVQPRRRLCPVVVVGCLLAAPRASECQVQSAFEIGIDRSNLTRESESVQETTLQGIRALNAVWFRDVLSATPKFVHELALAKRNDLKVLVNVLQAKTDYDDGYQATNAGEDFKKRCGWSQGSSALSQVNPAKFGQRLRSEFDAIKAANLTIDAFEIGNEDDWICFNGDVPDGHTPNERE